METPLLTIDRDTLMLGESQTKSMADKGFSPQSYGLNLLKEKGVLYFADAGTDRSVAALTDALIATSPDPAYLGNDQYMLGDTGRYYILNGSSLTLGQADSTNTYALGTTDMLVFKGEIFGTSNTNVTKLTAGMAAITATWWTTTRGHAALETGYRHPLEVVEDTMYIGDKNKIHTWDGTTSVASAMTLPTDVNIVSLRKHPDGQHLIAFCGTTADYSHTRGGRGRIYLIDTVNLEYVREIQTESQVEGTRTVGGVVYVTYGAKLGYFNGDGISWLRDLTAGSVTYSHQMSNIEDTLLIRDSKDLLAYGDLGGGGNAWVRLFRTEATSGSTFTVVGNKGNGIMLLGYQFSSSKKLYELPLLTEGATGSFSSNIYRFKSNVAIHRIEVDHTATPASGVNGFTILVYNETGDVLFNTDVSHTNEIVSTSRVDLTAFTDNLRISLYLQNGFMGFREIRVYGESIE